MPCVWNYCRLTFRACCSEEENRLVTFVVASNRQNHVSHTDIERRMNHSGYVKLFDGNLATLLNLSFVLAVLCVLNLVGNTRTTRFELDLSTENPLRIKLVVTGNNKARNAYRASVLLSRALAAAVEAVVSVILPRRTHLAISANAIFRISVFTFSVFLSIDRHRCHSRNHTECSQEFLKTLHNST